MKSKSISRASVHSSGHKMLPLPWWKWRSWIKLPQEIDLCPQGMGLYQGLSVGLCHWQVGHATVALLYWSWWMEAHVSYTMLTSHPCWGGHLVSPLGNDRSGWRHRLTDVHKMDHLLQLIKTLYSYLWRAFTWDANIFILCSPFKSSLCILLV